MGETMTKDKAKEHFISTVFDYGCKKDNCFAFQNIHITEKQKQVIRKAWANIEHLLVSDDEITSIIESFYSEFVS